MEGAAADIGVGVYAGNDDEEAGLFGMKLVWPKSSLKWNEGELLLFRSLANISGVTWTLTSPSLVVSDELAAVVG